MFYKFSFIFLTRGHSCTIYVLIPSRRRQGMRTRLPVTVYVKYLLRLRLMFNYIFFPHVFIKRQSYKLSKIVIRFVRKM